MREVFHGDLDQVTSDLVEMCALVRTAVERATQAILDADVQVAEQVIADDHTIDQTRHELDALAIDLLARQAPVATDLRRVVTAMRMSGEIERMGDLARHVAKLTRLRYPEPAVPDELRDLITRMGDVANRIVAKAGVVVAEHDGLEVHEVELIDDELDALHREMYTRITSESWTYGPGTAVDMALLGRYYERFGDHAVSVARRVNYMVTGELDGLPDVDERDDII
ncbi:phosphate signaling complex protein PhoU [Janibacter alkaliphilus]|uniref:Phosphate-specific transport system accessory protein PhoU n=1 Tax=Janibacter alkaliphilus TaxID=1069963 RepID=A0A852XEP1_9MICO|nr:phosphate transport system protein [Janibacter alkaliphilus]